MIKWTFRFLLVVIVVLACILLVKDHPGFVLIKYREYSLETTLAFGIVAIAVAVVLVYLVLKILRLFWRIPDSMKRQSQGRRYEKSRKLLNQGLIDLAEGRFDQAEKNLIKLVEFSESPLLHYLAAARAAQQQGKHDARDQYLKAAHEARPEAEIAIGVTQAELQLSHKQTEQALATLNHLHSIAPKHDHVLKLLARLYFEQKDWQSLMEILPNVRKKKLIKENKLKTMESRTYRGCLDQAVQSGGKDAIDKFWNTIPRNQHSDADLLLHYLELLNQHGIASQQAEQLFVKALDSQWDNRLINLYGQFESSDSSQQLQKAEGWLNDYGQNEFLLLALGRICIRSKLWGKAQGYLEASIGVRQMPENCLALAELFDQHLQQPEKAAEYYRSGLHSCVE